MYILGLSTDLYLVTSSYFQEIAGLIPCPNRLFPFQLNIYIRHDYSRWLMYDFVKGLNT